MKKEERIRLEKANREKNYFSLLAKECEKSIETQEREFAVHFLLHNSSVSDAEKEFLIAINNLQRKIEYCRELKKLKLLQSDKLAEESKIYNIHKMYSGQIFKSFKELCDFSGIKYPNGSKQNKLLKKQLLRYFDFYECKNSNEIVILEVYDTPLDKKLARSYRYTNELEKIIILYLINEAPKTLKKLGEGDYYLFRSYFARFAFKQLSIVSPYIEEHITVNQKCYYYIDEFLVQTYPDLFDSKNVYKHRNILIDNLYEKLREALTTTFLRMQREKLIEYRCYYKAKLEKDGNWIPLLSREEILFVEMAKDVALKELNEEEIRLYGVKAKKYNKFTDCKYNGRKGALERYDEFFSSIIKKKGWERIAYEFEVSYNPDFLQEYLSKTVKSIESAGDLKRVVQMNLNSALESKAVSYYEKKNQKYLDDKNKFIKESINELQYCNYTEEDLEKVFDNDSYKRKKFIDEYCSCQKVLRDYLVNPSSEHIEELDDFISEWERNVGDITQLQKETPSEEDKFPF